MADQLAEVVYLDYPNDLAFLRPTVPLPTEPGTDAIDSIDTFLRAEGLPVQTTEAVVLEALDDFLAGRGDRAGRCDACQRMVFEPVAGDPPRYCPYCGEAITLPGTLTDWVPEGVDATIEEIVSAAGYDPDWHGGALTCGRYGRGARPFKLPTTKTADW